jgi:hypothetical protein
VIPGNREKLELEAVDQRARALELLPAPAVREVTGHHEDLGSQSRKQLA